ncbi:MAG: SPOR domain-containing protein [Bdellovibrionota bacterium]
MRNFKQVDEKYTLTLDNRQVALFATVILGLFLLFFVLGVLYGTRLGEKRSAEAGAAKAAAPPAEVEETAQTSEKPAVGEQVFALKEEPIEPGEAAALREQVAASKGLEATPPAPPVETPKPKASPSSKPAASSQNTSSSLAGTKLSSMKGKYTIQVASFTKKADAQPLLKKLESRGYPAFLSTGKVKGKTYYRVRVGKFGTKEEADRLRPGLERAENLETFTTTVE